MKHVLQIFTILSSVIIISLKASAQCPYDNTFYLEGDVPTQVGDGVVASECWGGDLIRLTNMIAGYTYSISGCSTPSFDSELTIYPVGGGNPLAYDDDGCGIYGGPSSISFVCPANGDYDVLLDEYPCSSNTTNMDITITLMSTGGGTGGTPTTTIPVVVHVVWNTPAQNITDEQIMSQITALNRDYQFQNSDFYSVVPPEYQSLAADFGIEFCLASYDPAGNPTTGITRTNTNVTEFHINDNGVKHNDQGGHDNWDPTHYLNLWVCNLADGLLGYATFPTDLGSNAGNDGVVILYKAFGDIGSAETPYDLGRTATHEVGHWLNLRHIWGDDYCGDDFVNDTPVQQEANYACPDYPHITCNNGPYGDMFMNYMDYTNDNCMAMFTGGQKERSYATLATSRSGLANSAGCSLTAIDPVYAASSQSVYPNPNNGLFTVSLSNIYVDPKVEVFNIFGSRVDVELEKISDSMFDIHLINVASGVYFLHVLSENHSQTSRFVVQ